MDSSILAFAEQFKYCPTVQNETNMSKYRSFILCGMGGSHLAADFLNGVSKKTQILVHSDYGLPNIDDEYLSQSLIIISSFSGNTEEALDSYNCCKDKKFRTLILTSDSEKSQLLGLAKADKVPYIALPNLDIQPRMTLGFSLRALSYICDKTVFEDLEELAKTVVPKDIEERGKGLAEQIGEKIPVIYTSNHCKSLGYNWKIKLNETGKIPAFCNTFPELNHNEMMGFLPLDDQKTKKQDKFIFFFMVDLVDPRIDKRMDILKTQLEKLGYTVVNLGIGQTIRWKIETVLLADWISFYVAKNNGVDPEQVPLIEEFKSMLKK